MAAAASLVIAMYSYAGYMMVAAFSESNPGYPGHARATLIWSASGIAALLAAVACVVVAYRRHRANR